MKYHEKLEKPDTRETEEAKAAIKRWQEKLKGLAGKDRVQLSDDILLQVSFDGGPYIRVTYDKEKNSFLVHHLGSKQEFYSNPDAKFATAEQLDSYFSQPVEAIKNGELLSRNTLPE